MENQKKVQVTFANVSGLYAMINFKMRLTSSECQTSSILRQTLQDVDVNDNTVYQMLLQQATCHSIAVVIST